MFFSKLNNKLKILQCNSLSAALKRKLNTEKTKLEPVKLSYASYEVTNIPTESDPPPLIVVHGLFGSKGNWNSICKIYRQKSKPTRKIVAVDCRNHGESPHSTNHTYDHLAVDIKQLMGELKINKASLLGHSMGGRAVMVFALRYPELVEKLIVADISPVRTSPNLKTMPALFSAMRNVVLPNKIPLSVARASADQQLAKLVGNKGVRSFLLTNLVQRSDGSYTWRINMHSLSLNFDKIATFPKMENLTFNGPTLFLAGGSSDYVQKTDHPEILKLFTKAEFKYIAGAGHWLHSEKPVEFIQITLDFLNKIETK